MIPFWGLPIYPNNNDVTVVGANYTGFQMVMGEVFPIRNSFTTPTPWAPAGFTDPGINNVTLGTGYEFSYDSKVGNVRVPNELDVKDGVHYGSLDSRVGVFGEGTAPVFAGITGLAVQVDGSITASWSAAVDLSPPVVYYIYIKPDTATGLFSVTPFATTNLSFRSYTLFDNSPLIAGKTYHVGVRAVDAFNNHEYNTVSLSVISTGVNLVAAKIEANGSFSISNANMLQGTIWLTSDGEVVPSTSLLGVANYEVFNAAGASMGISQSGIASDATGKFIITPVLATSLQYATHYIIKVGIVYDGAERITYLPYSLSLYPVVSQLNKRVHILTALKG